MKLNPTEAMSLAIKEAKKGLGFVHPNPPVGCVVLAENGELLSKGYHQKFGGPHAEIEALNGIKNTAALKNSIWFVTLEPCAHEGKTPSCAKALAKLPIAKVYYGLKDPNPLVSGKGIEILTSAGIATELFSELQSELEELPEIFLYIQKEKMPFVALKVATSLDGQMAHRSGESKWLTGEESRTHVHYLRAQYDAVAVGRGTVATDNPTLNIRHPSFPGRSNKVVIYDRSAQSLRSDLNLFSVRPVSEVYCMVKPGSEAAARHFGVHVIAADSLRDGLKDLYQAGVTSLFVEGGATLHSAFLQARLVQRVYQFVAPTILGGESGLGWTRGHSIKHFKERLILKNMKSERFGDDILITGRL